RARGPALRPYLHAPAACVPLRRQRPRRLDGPPLLHGGHDAVGRPAPRLRRRPRPRGALDGVGHTRRADERGLAPEPRPPPRRGRDPLPRHLRRGPGAALARALAHLLPLLRRALRPRRRPRVAGEPLPLPEAVSQARLSIGALSKATSIPVQ